MKPHTSNLEKKIPNHEEIVTYLRDNFQKEFDEFPELNSQWYILRFCQARNFDKAKVALMMKNMFQWRRLKDMNRIALIDHSQYAEIEKLYVSGCCGVDKVGRPIFIERLGATNITELLNDKYARIREDYLIQRIERQIFVQLPMASEAAGKRIDNIFMIMDLKGISLSTMLGSKFKTFLKYLSQFSQDYYPEMLGKMFIVNAPLMIKIIWSMVKLWLDKKTTDKIEIHNNIPWKKLAEYVDMDQLPDFIGGKSKVSLIENYGPWKNALEESRAAKTLLLMDRTPEFKYFRVESDPYIINGARNLKDTRNIYNHQVKDESDSNKESNQYSDLNISNCINTRSGTVNLDSILNDEEDRFTDVRYFKSSISLRSFIF